MPVTSSRTHHHPAGNAGKHAAGSRAHASPGSIDIPPFMVPALRSDHAGETGAVQIYNGVMAVARNTAVRDFARHHLATEQRHLRLMNDLLPAAHHSRLLPVWRIAGWLTGALPALFGDRATYRTIAAVEHFVDRHYAAQIDVLRRQPDHADLCRLLEDCRQDELAHRDDALSRLGKPGLLGRVWTRMVGAGSALGVYLASRV